MSPPFARSDGEPRANAANGERFENRRFPAIRHAASHNRASGSAQPRSHVRALSSRLAVLPLLDPHGFDRDWIAAFAPSGAECGITVFSERRSAPASRPPTISARIRGRERRAFVWVLSSRLARNRRAGEQAPTSPRGWPHRRRGQRTPGTKLP